MTTDPPSAWIAFSIVPAITLYTLLFAFGARWWRTVVGWTHFAMTLGLMLLVDIAIVYYFLGDNYAARDWVRRIVFALISVGCWGALGAWFYERRRAKRTPSRRTGD